MLTYTCFETAWGGFALALSPRGVFGTILPVRSAHQAEQLARRRWPGANRQADPPGDLPDRIAAYFDGESVDFHVPLDLSGQTDFRRSVLRACARIAYGTTTTYGQLADEVGRPGAARAVGGAMAHNPIPLIVPCHRVLAANGRLGGFSAKGGLSVKTRMLHLEGTL